ncbi:DUF4397 domain-containing protein [Pendulispora rubella]|uniref:DUF4397 domain-containing protein n=1 Tax=Pendulispora rubella TaxID=2741070 RepID=A0ABZ2KUM4_9BACT
MRLRRFTFAFPLAALAGFVIAGCPDDKTLLHPEDAPDATTADTGTPDTGTDSGVQNALVRFAHLAVGSNDAIDVCVGKVPTSDGGSEDAGDAGDAGGGDAGAPVFTPIPVLRALQHQGGMKYKDVTKYFEVTPALAQLLPTGDVIIRVVDGTATDCSTAKAGTTDFAAQLPVIEPGSVRTVAAIGPANALGVRVFTDHVTTTDATKADVRVINAALPATGKFDFTVGANPPVTGVDFGATPAANQGYVAYDPFNAQAVSGQPAGATAAAFTVSGVSIAAKSVTTVFAIGTPQAAIPYAGLVCKDSAPAIGDFTDCGQVAPSDGGTDAGDSGTDAGDAGDSGP